MSRVDLSQSLFLRTDPFSFIDGATGIFDWTPLTARYNVSPTPQIADARAIASDFIITGNDLRAALAQYGRTD
ncbi:MAG: hypothetical protein AB7O44_29115 [Hyphomicrobiaceae bacterium]